MTINLEISKLMWIIILIFRFVPKPKFKIGHNGLPALYVVHPPHAIVGLSKVFSVGLVTDHSQE